MTPNSRRSNRAPNGIIVLTGAGASQLLGLPTLDNLLRTLDASLADEESIELIRRTRLGIEGNIHRFGSAVFEELISRLRYYLQIIDTLTNDHTFVREVGNLPYDIGTGLVARKWKRALTTCYRLLLNEYGPNKINPGSPEFATTLDLIGELSRLNGGVLHIYTTNYDCSYQVLASNCMSLCFFNQINNKSGTFSESWFPIRPDLPASNLPSVYVHRLHGCVAWFSREVPYEVFEVYGAGSKLTINDDDLLHRMCIKLITVQEIGTNVAFLSAYEQFYAHLESARALLIWGSSFRDMEVLRAIDNAFSIRKHPLPIYYINPFLDEEQVVDQILRTLRPVPVVISSQFRPAQIRWRPQQPGDALVEVVRRTFTQEVTR